MFTSATGILSHLWPTCAIISPAAGATITGAPIFVQAIVPPGTVSAVLKVGGTSVYLDKTSAWRFVYKPVSTGSHSLVVEATLSGGGVVTSAAVSVTVASLPSVAFPDFALPATTEATISIGGTSYDFRDGNAYLAGTSTFVAAFYSPGFYAEIYNWTGGVLQRITSPGVEYAVINTLSEGFESATTIGSLIGPTGNGFGQLTLQEAAAPTGAAAVALGNTVIGGGSFVVNRVEPSTLRARTGSKSLRVYCEAASASPTITKASLAAVLTHYVAGETIYAELPIYLESGTPLGLIDFECSPSADSAGIRLLLNSSLIPRFELKFGDKPSYAGTNPIPTGQWVVLRMEIGLHPTSGVIKLWVDGVLEIDTTGSTIPIDSIVYDRVQFGVTANSIATPVLLYIDDLRVQKTPFTVPNTITTTLSAAVQVAHLQTTTLSAAIQAPQSKTATLSAAVQVAQTKTATLSAAVQLALTKTSTLDVAVQASRTLTGTLNLAVQASHALTASADAAVQAGFTKTATIDAYVQSGLTKAVTLDVAVQQARTLAGTIDAVVQATRSATSTLDVPVQAARNLTTTLDAYVQAGFVLASTIDVAVQAGRTSTTTLTAAVQVSRSLTSVVDVAVSVARTLTMTLSAVVETGRTLASTIDVLVLVANTLTSTLSVAVQQARTATATLDLSVQVARTLSATLNAVVSISYTKSATIDAAIRADRALAASLDVYVFDPAGFQGGTLGTRVIIGTASQRTVLGRRNSTTITGQGD